MMAWIALMGFKAIGLSIEFDFLLGIDIYVLVYFLNLLSVIIDSQIFGLLNSLII